MKKFKTIEWTISLEVAANRMADYGHSTTAKHLQDLQAWIHRNLDALKAIHGEQPADRKPAESACWHCDKCNALNLNRRVICGNCRARR